MVQRSDQRNYLTSLIQWITKDPQPQQENCRKTNPRQQLMFARHLRRNRTAYRQSCTLPDCESSDANYDDDNNENDVNLT